MAEQPEGQTPQANNEARETNIASVMTSTSMHKHPTAFHNTRLPVLQAALNPEAMTALLAPMLAGLARGSEPAVTYARLLAYKQGNRGLIQYEIGSDAGESYQVLGKLYPDASQAARVYAIMRTLWDDVFTDDPAVSVPQPLGCLADLSMLVYLPALGNPLNEVIASEHALRYMELSGTWLGTLHNQRLPLQRQLNLANEVVNTQAWATLVGNTYPDQAEAAASIASYLRERVGSLRLETQSPIHKDFHHAHIVVADHGPPALKVIDLDELRLGDPNFDLAHFCANLHLLAYRTSSLPFSFSVLQNAFLNAYIRRTGWVSDERCLYFYAYTCLKIAKQLCSMRGLRPRPQGEEQHLQVQLMLQQGLGALPQSNGKMLAGGFATLVTPAVR
jgi:hypothetical protein